MAAITILITGVGNDGSNLTLYCQVFVAGDRQTIDFEVVVAAGSSAADTNDAIEAAAIVAADNATAFTVGASDNKTLLGGAAAL
jgi:hypothetical protein